MKVPYIFSAVLLFSSMVGVAAEEKQASSNGSFFVELPDKYTGATIYPNAVIQATFNTENGVRWLRFLAPESIKKRQEHVTPDRVTIGEETFTHFIECPKGPARELTYAEHVALIKQLRPALELPAEKSTIELTDDERNPPCPCGCGGTMMQCGYIGGPTK